MEPLSPAPQSGVSWRGGVLLATLVVLAYLPIYTGGFIWDDDDYVTENPLLVDFAGLARIWLEPDAMPQFYPLVHTSYWLEYQLWGLHPSGYHIVNVLLHTGCAWILWQVLRRLGLSGAWVIAALWALHPMNVQSVAWITERKNVLCGLLTFGSLYVLQPSFGLAGDRTADRSARRYAAGLLLFVGAMLSKTIACSLPVVVLLLIGWKRGRLSRGELLRLAPMFTIGLALGLNTVWLERAHVRAVGEAWDFTLIERTVIAGRVLWFYAWKIFMPGELMFAYAKWEIDASRALQWLAPLAWAAGLVLLWQRRAVIGRGACAAMLMFTAVLFPALGFFNIYWHRYYFVADHMVYLAAAPLLALGVTAVQRHIVMGRERLGRSAAVIVLALAAFYTAVHAASFRSAELVWQDTLAKNPDAWLARNNLALLYRESGRIEQALVLLEEAVDRDPEALEPRLNLGQLWNDLGRPQEAIRQFHAAMEISPGDHRALYGAAEALWQIGAVPQARQSFAMIVEQLQGLDLETSPMSAFMLARAYVALDRPADAASVFTWLAGEHPSMLGPAMTWAGRTYEDMQQPEAAAAAYAQAIEGTSAAGGAEAMSRLSRLYANWPDAGVHDPSKALHFAHRAVEATAGAAPRYLDSLAMAQARAGRFDEAVATARQAIALAEKGQFSDLAREIDRRLTGYRQGQAYTRPERRSEP